MNFAEIKRKITSYLKRTNFNFQLDDLVNSAMRDMERIYTFNHMLKEAKNQLLPEGATGIIISDDIKDIERFAIVENDIETAINKAFNINQIYTLLNSQAGRPIVYLLINDTIRVAPKTDKEYTYNLYYYAYTPPLVNNTDSNIWTEGLWDIFLYWILYEAYLLLGNETDAAKYYRLAQVKLAEQYKQEIISSTGKRIVAI